MVERRLERNVEAHPEVAVGVEPLDPLDVRDCLASCEVLAIGAGERLAVALEERPGALLAELLRERVAEVVGPGSRRRREAGLDLGDVVLRSRARLRVDDEVDTREHRLGELRRVVDADAAQGLPEDLLDSPAIPRVEALARQVDETREEAGERVSADEEPHAPALVEVEDAERGLEQLVLRDLEQLVARVRLEDLDQRLVVVTALREPRSLDDALSLAAENGDLPRALAVGGVRVEPEEPPLAGDLAGGVEALHADVVEVRGPVHGRPRVRLRQGEQALLAREPSHLRRQLREADGDRPLVAGAKDAEARAGHGAQHVLPVLGEDVVLAIAEEGEVVVVDPLEQVTRLRELVRRDRRHRLVESPEQTTDALAHRRPVVDRSAHVLEDAAQAGAHPLERLGTRLPVDLHMDQRLGQPFLAADLEQPALVVPPDAHDRPDHEVDRSPAPRHRHRDRVDEERHVVDDRLDDGVPRLPPVLLDVGRVDVHLQLAGSPDAREVPVRDRRTVEIEVAPVGQVVGSDVRVVRADEPLDVFRLVALDVLVHARDRGLEERRLPLIWPRRQSPSSLRDPPRSMDYLRGRDVPASRRRGATSAGP